MSEAQKSKRDLKDVVNVFLSKSDSQETGTLETSTKTSLLETQIVSFFSPFNEEETFTFNAIFPSFLGEYFSRRFLATNSPDPRMLGFLRKIYGSRIPVFPDVINQKIELTQDYYWIHWTDKRLFEEQAAGSLHSELSAESKRSENSLIVLDLLQSNAPGFDYLIRLLDQMVLVIRPRIEDLKNAYKVIKACYYINRQMETSVIFNAQMTQSEVEKVFSRFSEIVSEFLVLPVRCYGAALLEPSSSNLREIMTSKLSFESMLFSKSSKQKQKAASLERIRFLQKLTTLME